MKNEENFKIIDKANILIGFYDDNGMITKENLFFKKDIEIKETDIDNISGIFHTETINDIKPTNYKDNLGYVFEYFEHGAIVQLNETDNAMVYISKKPYEDMKKDFFGYLTNDCQSKIKRLEKRIIKEKKQIEIFENMKG